MKFNLPNTLFRLIRKSSLSSRILFVLCVILGLLMLAHDGGVFGVFLLATGLAGVLWLSSIAMHSFKSGRASKYNPFTFLIAICATISVLCLCISRFWTPIYQESDEPFNLYCEQLQNRLNCIEEASSDSTYYEELTATQTLQEVRHNIILTDENGTVLYAKNDWLRGSSDVIYALHCPVQYSDEDSLMIFTDENGNVVSALQVETDWCGDVSSDSSAASLTIQTEQENAVPSVETASVQEQLYDRYFPSFGKFIDQNAIALISSNLECISDSSSHSNISLSIQTWNGETISNIYGSAQIVSNKSVLISELNSLTATQRTSLKKYLQWLESALDTAKNSDGLYHPNRVRIMNSSNGSLTLYLIYQDSNDSLRPNFTIYLRNLQILSSISAIGILMIPAIIVFLAFWVFVDATKRGQTNPAFWAVLTLIGNFIAWLIYMIIRPQMTIALSGQSAPRGVCPLCGAKLRNDFISCPGCGILLRNRCKTCGRALENDWNFCPYCTSAISGEIAENNSKE